MSPVKTTNKTTKRIVGFLAVLAIALPSVWPAAAYQVAVFPPPPTPYPEPAFTGIIQLNNLTVQSVSGPSKPGIISAAADTGIYCLGFQSTEGAGFRAPCPDIAAAAYQLDIAADTILLFRNRRRAALADIMPGDRINVFGFMDPNSGEMQALIVRDLSRSGSYYPNPVGYTQLNNLRVVSAPSSPVPPASLTATAVNPCGGQIPCTLMSILYTVNISPNTQILNAAREPLPLASVQSGDVFNVYGQYAAGVMNALILRDLTSSGNGGGNPGAGPVLTGVAGPVTLAAGEQGTWIVNASDPANGTLNYSAAWGDSLGQGYVYPQNGAVSQPVQQSATFTHAYQNPGTYTPRFTVTNSMGQSASASLTVVVQGGAPSSGQVQLFSLNPPSGPAGTQITLTGSGFMPMGNIVHFSMSGYSAYLPNISANGNTLTFSAPGYSSMACEYATPRCLPPDYQLITGTYQVSVENANGVSNPLNFTLTAGPVAVPLQH